MPGHPGVGWVPATPTWHTGIVGQAGNAPKCHLSQGDVLGCNPQEQAAGLADTRSLGREAGGGQDALSHRAMPMPSCLDATVMDAPHPTHYSVGMG